MPLVSVIMPVYRVEECLTGAVEGILAQTMRDFELLLIDDGSPDDCGRMCDQFAARDARVQVIHQHNQGAAGARNTGIRAAAGKYLYFCDADDIPMETLLERLTSAAQQYDAELVVCGYRSETDIGNGKMYRKVYAASEEAFYDNAQAFRDASLPLFERMLLYVPWNKLYLRERIEKNDLYYPLTFWDDYPFNLNYIRDVERVCVLPDVLYRFLRNRPESENTKYNEHMYEKREEEDGQLCDLFAHWQCDSAPYREFRALRYVERLLGCIENLTDPKCRLTRREKLDSIHAMLTSERAVETLPIARPHSAALRILLIPLRLHAVRWTYLQSLFISFCKTNLAPMFVYFKETREGKVC